MFKTRSLRIFAVVVGMLVLAGMFYAFAAANVVSETGAGVGDDTISGYTITNVTYTLVDANPDTMSAVEFDLAATAGAGTPSTVDARVVDSGTWYDCIAGTPPAWSCAISPAIDVSTVNTLTVAAAE